MTVTLSLNAPTAPARTARPPRKPWARGLVDRVKARIARAIGLPAVLPGKDGWYQ